MNIDRFSTSLASVRWNPIDFSRSSRPADETRPVFHAPPVRPMKIDRYLRLSPFGR